MGQFGIGQGIKRFEDVRLLKGRGRFHEDVNIPGQAHAVIVRSVHAHARIVGIDASVAVVIAGQVERWRKGSGRVLGECREVERWRDVMGRVSYSGVDVGCLVSGSSGSIQVPQEVPRRRRDPAATASAAAPGRVGDCPP